MSAETKNPTNQELSPQVTAQIEHLGNVALGIAKLDSTPMPTYENGATLDNPHIKPGAALPKRPQRSNPITELAA